MGLQIGVANRVEQVGLALSGRRFEIERRELRLFQRRHALRCVAGQHVGLASDESRKGQRRVEPDRRGEIGIPHRSCRHRDGRCAVIGGTAAIIEPEFRQLAAAGVNLNIDHAHFAARNLPRQLQPIMKTVAHPVGGKFGRQIEIERAGFPVETAELDRLDPLAVELMAQILAQALTDVGPIGGEIYGF